eukprot:TRINITY_DN7497_c0_g2_i1.p1 TRINITY_DN7497_c0_g2~~TRINITY_DN7497_c0_g2_i1.p1  ORF type:complete len:261 (-),score=69.54 TRINITY_DN7497_c0_g2_i1:421-1203(-)
MAFRKLGVTVVGAYPSPYVRKVLACLHLKNVAYRIDPIVPALGNAEFETISPLRRVPVLLHGDAVISDSTAICEYIDEVFPGAPLLPSTAVERARARELEEFADSNIGQVMMKQLFALGVLPPGVLRPMNPAEKAILTRTVEKDIPRLLNQLEAQLPEDGFLFGTPGLADIAIASPFRNAAWVHFAIDPARWPRSSAYVTRVLDHPALASLRPFEDLSMHFPPPMIFAELAKAGAPLAETTFGLDPTTLEHPLPAPFTIF